MVISFLTVLFFFLSFFILADKSNAASACYIYYYI